MNPSVHLRRCGQMLQDLHLQPGDKMNAGEVYLLRRATERTATYLDQESGNIRRNESNRYAARRYEQVLVAAEMPGQAAEEDVVGRNERARLRATLEYIGGRGKKTQTY